jgi:moderate conductance mechanosensitive channel
VPMLSGPVASIEFAQVSREIEVCGEEAGRMCRLVLEITDSSVMAQAADFLLARPLKILLILVLAWLANRLARRAIRQFVLSIQSNAGTSRFESLKARTPAALATTGQVSVRAGQRAETLGAVLRSLTTVVIWTFAALMVLGELAVNLGPLIAGASIIGVAVGFGAQTLVRDFLSGIFMLIEDQFGVGDIINVGDAAGTVEGVSLRTTRIRDVEGVVWHVPNGEIHRVANMSQEWSRALVDVEVAYATDIGHAKDVIQRVADDLAAEAPWDRAIVAEPSVWGVQELGADGIAIRLVIKTKPAEQWAVLREFKERIKAAFDAEGIEIPFPQRAVWVRNEAQRAHEGRGEVSGSP